jgi:hypothetical protein
MEAAHSAGSEQPINSVAGEFRPDAWISYAGHRGEV